jgi:hyaluronoglucosaminidase
MASTFTFSLVLRGEKITILYDPGFFPALGSKNERRNGGVPQEGNLTKHLQFYREHINELVRVFSHAYDMNVVDPSQASAVFRCQMWTTKA